ncbi:Uncharacterised protein [Legionella pneumophila]|nr:Uncharacterised protein [Legionella pneumophila]CZG22041.1 Uncharacterised protein [Legionella pneumophila]
MTAVYLMRGILLFSWLVDVSLMINKISLVLIGTRDIKIKLKLSFLAVPLHSLLQIQYQHQPCRVMQL